MFTHLLPATTRIRFWLTSAVFLSTLVVSAAKTVTEPVLSWQKQSDGVSFQLPHGTLKLQVWTPRTIRVRFTPTAEVSSRRSLTVISSPQRVPWRLTVTPKFVSISTEPLQVRVDRKTSAVRFLDSQGHPILSETPGGRSLTPLPAASSKADPGFSISQSFEQQADEDIYGLGQHRLPTSQGNMSYRGIKVSLEQANREVAIPFLTSSRGSACYGIAPHIQTFPWERASPKRFHPASCSRKTDGRVALPRAITTATI